MPLLLAIPSFIQSTNFHGVLGMQPCQAKPLSSSKSLADFWPVWQAKKHTRCLSWQRGRIYTIQVKPPAGKNNQLIQWVKK